MQVQLVYYHVTDPVSLFYLSSLREARSNAAEYALSTGILVQSIRLRYDSDIFTRALAGYLLIPPECKRVVR